MKNNKPYKIAFSIGDANGIGIEIILKALENLKFDRSFIPIIYAPSNVMKYTAENIGVNFKFNYITKESEAKTKTINVIDSGFPNFFIEFGKSKVESGEIAFKSLERAAKSVMMGNCDALVTAPINKDNIQSKDFSFPGHTEYLEKLWKGESLMFMVHDDLKIGLVTNHLPIQEVAQNVNVSKIKSKLDLIFKSLTTDFGIIKPKVAVLGLNPHAGDNGLLGKEEKEIIIPALKEVIEENHIVFGPYPADSFFTPKNISQFDAILAMYHDQGLIPFKTLAGLEGVNFTAGLPFVRTSPDHGVAFDIAGKNSADSSSMVAAIEAAVEILNNRQSADK